MSPNPAVVTSAARPALPSMSAFVISVVAWTIGAVMSAGRTPVRGEQLGDARAHAVERVRRRGQHLVDGDRARSPRRASTTSVNVPPMSTASRQSVASVTSSEILSRRGEHVEDPALAVLVVADEHRVAVPDVRRGEVDVARAEHDPLVVVGLADAEVELRRAR